MILAAHLAGLLLTAVVSAVAAWWTYRRANDRAGRTMVVLLLMHVVMAVLATAELLSASQRWMVVWMSLWYTLSLVAPVVWLLLAIFYTGQEYWLSKPVRALLAAEVVLPTVLIVTNPVHELVFVDVRIEPEPFAHLATEPGATIVLIGGVLYINILIAAGLFLRLFLFSRRMSRTQTVALLGGMLFIVITAAASLTSRVPIERFPYGIVAAGLFGVVLTVVLFRTRLFAVAPLARDVLFESLEEAVIVLDRNRAIVDYNDRALGYFPALSAHYGEPVDDAIPELVDLDEPTTDGGGVEAIVEQLDGTIDSPFAGKLQLRNGEESWTLRISVSEITRGGEPHGYALIARDVTELERYATELELKTSQLERFASTLSHDLRNPVSVAKGYVELERETRDSEPLEHAEQALERIDETIGDLLTLSKEGERIENPEPLSLATVADEAWKTSDTGEATLRIELDEDGTVYADDSRLKTMLENLFRNAVDHGGSTVWIGALETDVRDGFYVADDGPGVPEDERDRIFEHGYSSSEDGTGFGLAIVETVAEAHDWEVSVTESEDGGARFEITTIDRR